MSANSSEANSSMSMKISEKMHIITVSNLIYFSPQLIKHYRKYYIKLCEQTVFVTDFLHVFDNSSSRVYGACPQLFTPSHIFPSVSAPISEWG